MDVVSDIEREAAEVLLGDVDLLPLGSCKLQQSGHGYYVAFPVDQVRAVNLKKGDSISLFWSNKERSLVSTPTAELEQRTAVAEI